MAGGKETPRQKMIGMMYLVLTALLALNVSKQILDAFVAIEENIQRGSITQLERGNAAKSALIEEMSSTAKLYKVKGRQSLPNGRRRRAMMALKSIFLMIQLLLQNFYPN